MIKNRSLASRTVWVMVAVVVIAVVVAAVISFGLLRTSARNEARKSLVSQADVVASLLDAGRPGSLRKALHTVRMQRTPVAWVQGGGAPQGDPLARNAYENYLKANSNRASFATVVNGQNLLVEVRQLRAGDTLIFAARTSLATGPTLEILRRELIAMAIGLVVALIAAILFARRLSEPLKRTAAAAVQLASGDRDVRLDSDGPAEIADVSEAINSLANALRQSETRQREFLLSVSHELRTPLTAIRGFGESLADGVTTGSQVPVAGRVIAGESVRLERLVSDLLDMSRLGSDNFKFDFALVDVRQLMLEAAEVWRARCTEVGVDFSVTVGSDSVWIQTDPGRVRQIVDGLAENALRVTPSGRPLIFALHTDVSAAVIEVRDGGPGLDDDDLAVAFERSALYERYKGVRKVGTGLGLALVKTLATGLGGTVSAGHAPEGGSTFTVRLPR